MPPPLSLYIHVPWCLRKCPYCDFNSHQRPEVLPESEYIQALLADLAGDADAVRGRALHSIFIGGGTPSLFSPRAFEALLGGIDAVLPLANDLEITLEANPGTFEQEKFSAFRRRGINRLSIGVQSFDPRFLEALGRVHGGEEARRAADIARKAGFDNINLDLMFGLPGQRVADAVRDLETAAAAGPEHLSWYQLTLEPNTAFYRYPPELPGEDILCAMQEEGQSLLGASGYRRYEISAYSRPGRECAHNLNYWTFGDYLGIGAGAHGKLTLSDGRIVRTRKTRQPAHYLDSSRPFTAAEEEVKAGELPLEFMMNAMRLPGGSDRATYEARTGLPFSTVAPSLERLARRALVRLDGSAFRPAPRGLVFLNDLLLEFMDPDAPGKIPAVNL